jgi:hypothetical protein
MEDASENGVDMTKLTRNQDLIAAEMDGDVVMLSIEDGQYYGPTGIAPRIWECLETLQTVEQLLGDLLQHYDVAEDVLRADLDGFLTEMQKNGLLRLA